MNSTVMLAIGSTVIAGGGGGGPLGALENELSMLEDHALTLDSRNNSEAVDQIYTMVVAAVTYAEKQLGLAASPRQKSPAEMPGTYRIFTIEPGTDPASRIELWGHSFAANNVWVARKNALSEAHEQGKFLRDTNSDSYLDSNWVSVGPATHRLQLETGYLYIKRMSDD